MKFEVPDNKSLSEGFELFKGLYRENEFIEQSEVNVVVKILENPDYHFSIFGYELFPGRIYLKPHDYMHVLCNSPGTNNGEAFVIGATMGSTGKMNWFKSFLYLWLTNFFAPKMFHFNSEARKIFYRVSREAGALAKRGALKDLSKFEPELYLNNQVGSVRKTLGIDLLLQKCTYSE